MHLDPGNIIRASWAVLAVFWVVTARGVKRPSRTVTHFSRFVRYTLPLIVAIGLIGPGRWFGETVLYWRLLPDVAWTAYTGAVIVVAGAALAIWARLLLGRNWSVAPQLKNEHELIESGPYAWVRHPIYTGLLLMFLGTAVAIGELRGWLALIIVGVSFWFKLRFEERWLTEHFGASYRDYMQRTRALIPGIL